MLCLYETLQEVGVSQLSSSRQIAEVNTSMDEVAIFLKLRPLEPEVSDTQEEVKENVQTKPAGPAKKKGFVARFLHKLRHIS